MWLVAALACGGAPTGGTPSPVDSTPAPVPTVPEPTIPPVFDPASGFERTADGAVNRVADVPSSPEDYAFGTQPCYGSLSQTEPECVPEGCTERPNGRCAAESCLTTWCTCVYACTSDADCAPTEACLRPEHGLEGGIPLPTCVPATCRTNADCPSGECGVTVVPESPTDQLRLACRTPDDLCRVAEDCEGGETCAGYFAAWECQCSHCWCD